MSADADRKTCGHTFYGKTCSNCRVAQLTAELAEARTRFLEAEMRHRVGCPMYMGKSGGECTCGVILLNLERAAHERTKAELAELRKQLESAHTRLNDADGALQDAGTPVVDERFDGAIQRLHAERDAALARAEKVEAELAEARKVSHAQCETITRLEFEVKELEDGARSAIAREQAAQARARRWKAGARHLYQLRQGDADGYWRDFHAANARAERRRADKAEAEAATMREMLEEVVRACDQVPTDPKMFARKAAVALVMMRGGAAMALTGNAGRALAARVLLLEVVAKGLKEWRDQMEKKSTSPHSPAAWLVREVDARFPQLAALDEKGAPDGA
jgi:hypothetical protein